MFMRTIASVRHGGALSSSLLRNMKPSGGRARRQSIEEQQAMSEFAKWRRAPGWRVSRRAGELGREGDGKAGNFFRRRRLEAVTRGAEPNAVLSVGTTARLTQPLANFSPIRRVER